MSRTTRMHRLPTLAHVGIDAAHIARASTIHRRATHAVRRFGLGGGAGATIVVLALDHGGYAPAAWGWTALLGFWVSVLALGLRSDCRVDRAGALLVGGLALLSGLTALSSVWTQSVPRTLFELERDLAYVAVGAAVLLLCDSRAAPQLLGGLCGGSTVVAAWSLGSYLTSEPRLDATQGYLLFRPIGYANALGGLAAMGLPLLLAYGAHARRAAAAIAGASAVVVSVALYLTQNRSAAIALGVALAVWLWRTDAPQRAMGTLALIALPAGVALLVTRGAGLFDTGRPIAALASRRTEVCVVVIGLALAASLLVPQARRVSVPGSLAVRGAHGAAALAGVGLLAALLRLGDRAQYWAAAWRAFREHPLLGTGAGTFDEQWLRLRGSGVSVRDAHSLYLETLSDLGVVGLLLLLAVLALPVVASRRSRDPLTTACLAAYCAFLVHAAFEWDWEMPVVTVAGLLLASVLVRARPATPQIALGGPARLAAAAAITVVGAFAVVALAGNSDVAAAERLVAHGDAPDAAASALRARRLLPWSSEPWLVIADAAARAHRPALARAALREAVARDRSDWAVWLRLAGASRGSERAEALRHAIELDPRLFTAGVGS